MTEETTWREDWKLPFFSIWTGQAFSFLGSRIAQFALIWWLTQMTGSATVLATASLVGILPEILLGPFAGAYVDRLNRRWVMIIADGAIALASLWLAVMFWIGAAQVWHIYVIMALRALGGAFHWPAMQSSTSLMVPKKHLTRVSGMNQTLYGSLSIAGPPLGALLMELLPLGGVMLIDVGSAALAIAPLFFVAIPQPQRDAGAGAPSILMDMWEGLRYAWDWAGLRYLIAVAMVFKLVLTPASSLMPLLVNQHFGGDAAQLSLFQAMSGIGAVIGGLALSAWGGFQRKIFTTMAGMIGFSLAFVTLGLLPGNLFTVGLGANFIVGLMIPFIDGPLMAILQANVAPEMQGRVLSTMSSLLWVTSPIGLGVAGPVSDALGLQVWYLVAGGMCLLSSFTVFVLPALRDIEENAIGKNSVASPPAGGIGDPMPVRVEAESCPDFHET